MTAIESQRLAYHSPDGGATSYSTAGHAPVFLDAKKTMDFCITNHRMHRDLGRSLKASRYPHVVELVYEALVECSEYDGEAPYRFDQVPQTRSDDGWVRALDGRVRGSFYGAGVARPARHDSLLLRIASWRAMAHQQLSLFSPRTATRRHGLGASR